MHINYTLPTTSVNGGVRAILEIANHLIERGHQVTITTFGSAADTAWFPLQAPVIYVGEEATGVRRLVKSSGRMKQLYGRHASLRKLAAGIGLKAQTDAEFERACAALATAIPDCDVSVATYCMTAFPVIQAHRGRPYYHMQHHEVIFFDDPHLKRRAAASYRLPLELMANSSWLKHTIEQSYGLSDVPIVPGAVDHNTFYPRGGGPPNNRFRVISLGRSERWKGFPELVNAMKIVMQRYPVEWIVFAANEPPYGAANAPYRFVRSPTASDLAELYSSCHVAVNPSWYESFPLPPIEAMACGTAVVTTPYGTEDYAQHERTAIVTPPRNSRALADSIIRLLDDRALRLRLAKAGRQESLMFTWAGSAARVEQLLAP